MTITRKTVVQAALVVALGGGLAVGSGAAAAALTLPDVPVISDLIGSVGDDSLPIGDDSPPVGDDSPPVEDTKPEDPAKKPDAAR